MVAAEEFVLEVDTDAGFVELELGLGGCVGFDEDFLSFLPLQMKIQDNEMYINYH